MSAAWTGREPLSLRIPPRPVTGRWEVRVPAVLGWRRAGFVHAPTEQAALTAWQRIRREDWPCKVRPA